MKVEGKVQKANGKRIDGSAAFCPLPWSF